MSADNGIYIAEFRNADGFAEYRVAHAFASVIDEIDSHHYTPEEAREQLHRIFGEKTYRETSAALLAAKKLLDEVEYTEYGIVWLQFDRAINDLREPIAPPEIPDGACPHCSTPGYSTSYHFPSIWNTDCRDPELPANIIRQAIRQECRGVSEGLVVQVVIDALRKHFTLTKVLPVDPELEKLLAEEEEIERQNRGDNPMKGYGW